MCSKQTVGGKLTGPANCKMENSGSDASMQGSDHPATPQPWLYPHFESIVGTIESHVTKDRSSMDPGQDSMVYTLQEGFLTEDRTWMKYVRRERMRKNAEVLYRANIVKAIVQDIEELLTSDETAGLLVKGPQGVGKSYSLINLTRYLLASGKYWVTIFPNCEYWRDEYDFFQILLQSVGVDRDRFGLDYNATTDSRCRKLIAGIDTVLSRHGKKWVFIFDQINRIFARLQFHNAKDVGVLPFPFDMMKLIIKPGRIISIISASANSDVSHKKNHEGFDVFEHPIQFDKDEIKVLYPERQIAQWDWDDLEFKTGCVPLYLNQWVKDPDRYSGDVHNDVEGALEKLRDDKEKKWEAYVKSAIQCLLLLSLPREPRHFDRKFLLVQSTRPDKYNITALFPFVEGVYRTFFWEALGTYIVEEERNLLDICNNPNTSAQVRGRLFESIVITRLVSNTWSPDAVKSVVKGILTEADIKIDNDWDAALQQPADKVQLPNNKYPEFDSFTRVTTFYIPMKDNFPAVDLIIRTRNIVITFHITIEIDHDEVLTKLLKKAENAGWKEGQVDKIILVYLCPQVSTKKNLDERIVRTKKARTLSSVSDWVITRFYSIADREPLRDIQWTMQHNKTK